MSTAIRFSLNSPTKDDDLNERLIALRADLFDQIQSSSSETSSIEQTVDHLSTIFQFLHHNLRVKQQLADTYNDLSQRIQIVVSTCAQYIHERHEHEKELLILKDQICRSLGHIGSTQFCLEHYRTIIHSLEHETERLGILLSNPQLNQRKLQTSEQNQRIQLDRLIKVNEQVQLSMVMEKSAIEKIQTQINADLQELQKFKTLLNNAQSQDEATQQHWSKIEKQSSYLRTITEKTQELENEYHHRLKLTKTYGDQMQQRLHNLTNTYEQSKEQLTTIVEQKMHIEHDVETVQNKIFTEQTLTTNICEQIQNLQHESHQLDQQKRRAQQMLQSEEHTNGALKHKQLLMERKQYRLSQRVKQLTQQFNSITAENRANEKLITRTDHFLQKEQEQMITMNIALSKLMEMNNHLESILRQNHFIRIEQQEKLRSMKQVTFQKRKELMIYAKRLHSLSLKEHQYLHQLTRNSMEIIQMHHILQHSRQNEKHFDRVLREKKTTVMKKEKQRASLARIIRDQDDECRLLLKRNQLIDNELRNKMDHIQFLNKKMLEQKHDQTNLSNERQLCLYTNQRQKTACDELQNHIDQTENLFHQEINRIFRKYEEAERLKLANQDLRQQISSLASRTKRQMGECFLLKEKIRLYEQMNDRHSKEQQQCSSDLQLFVRQIYHLQQENKQLLNKQEILQQKSLIIVRSHQDQILTKEHLYQMNQNLSHRPFVISDGSTHRHTQRELQEYPSLVDRLVHTVEQCIHWRQKLLNIDRLYSMKIAQIQQQRRRHHAFKQKETILRSKLERNLRKCKAAKAEQRMELLQELQSLVC